MKLEKKIGMRIMSICMEHLLFGWAFNHSLPNIRYFKCIFDDVNGIADGK